MQLGIGSIIAIVFILLTLALLWLCSRKHFCNRCKIAYIYSPGALKKTHCDECGYSLTGMILFDEGDEDAEEGSE